jgi:hypothetical protein
LIPDDLVLDLLGMVGELARAGVAHDLRVVLERIGDLLLWSGREHPLCSPVGEEERHVASMIARRTPTRTRVRTNRLPS